MQWMFLPLKRYADFRGRSRRREYWLFALFLLLVYLVMALTIGAAAVGILSGGAGASGFSGASHIMALLFGLFLLAILIPALAVGVRRLHDIDRTGWWIVAPTVLSVLSILLGGTGLAVIFSLLSVVASITLLVFACLEGTRGPNRFGPDPKDPAAGADLNEVFR